MPTNEKTEAMLNRLEDDPMQAVRLAVATFLLNGLNAGERFEGEAADLIVRESLAQADWLIANTIGVA